MAKYIDKTALVAEIEKLKAYLQIPNAQLEAIKVCDNVISVINTFETKDVDFERELGKYVSESIHRFFPGMEDDYCTMDSAVWQDYVIETAEHFYELGLKAQKGE